MLILILNMMLILNILEAVLNVSSHAANPMLNGYDNPVHRHHQNHSGDHDHRADHDHGDDDQD